MTTVRPPPRTAFEYVERSWRPAFAWVLLLCIAVPFCLFVAVLLGAFAYGVLIAVTTGRPIPDITGGLDRLLAPAWPYIAGGLGGLFTMYISRAHQVNTEIRSGGGQGRPPFDPSPPLSSPSPPADLPGGGLVNNQAIDPQGHN